MVFSVLAALLTPVRVVDAPQNQELEMMIPVVQFQVSGNSWIATWGLLGERGGFMKLGQESLRSDDHPAINGAKDKASWIDTKKLRTLRQIAPKGTMHFTFGPEVTQWRNGRWVRVRPPTVPRGSLALESFLRNDDELRRDTKS